MNFYPISACVCLNPFVNNLFIYQSIAVNTCPTNTVIDSIFRTCTQCSDNSYVVYNNQCTKISTTHFTSYLNAPATTSNNSTAITSNSINQVYTNLQNLQQNNHLSSTTVNNITNSINNLINSYSNSLQTNGNQNVSNTVFSLVDLSYNLTSSANINNPTALKSNLNNTENTINNLITGIVANNLINNNSTQNLTFIGSNFQIQIFTSNNETASEDSIKSIALANNMSLVNITSSVANIRKALNLNSTAQIPMRKLITRH